MFEKFEKDGNELVQVRIAIGDDPCGDDDIVVWIASEGGLDGVEVQDLGWALRKAKDDWIGMGRGIDPDLMVKDAIGIFSDLHGKKLSIADMPPVSHLYV